MRYYEDGDINVSWETIRVLRSGAYLYMREVSLDDCGRYSGGNRKCIVNHDEVT